MMQQQKLGLLWLMKSPKLRSLFSEGEFLQQCMLKVFEQVYLDQNRLKNVGLSRNTIAGHV